MAEGTEDLLSGAGSDPQASGSGDGGEGSKDYVSRKDFEALQSTIGDQFQALNKALEGNRQSTKDVIEDRVSKAVAPALEVVRGMGPVLQGLKQRGLLAENADPLTIQRQLAMEAAADQVLSPSDAARASAASATQQASQPAGDRAKAEVDRILQEHGLTGKEPELVEYANGVRGKPLLEQLVGLNNLAAQIAGRKSGDGSSLLNVGSGQLSHDQMQTQIDNYIRDAAAARGKGTHAWEPIKARYRAMGVPVDRINLMTGQLEPEKPKR